MLPVVTERDHVMWAAIVLAAILVLAAANLALPAGW